MKYAIIDAGGKQYKAVEGTTIRVDRLNAEIGDQIDLDNVLMVVDGEKVEVGAPQVEGVKVNTKVVSHVKGPKIIVFKYKAKKRIRTKTGHRQQYTDLLVESIEME